MGPDPAPFIDVGRQVAAALSSRLPAWESDALIADALADAIGDKAAQTLIDTGGAVGRLGARDLATAALGAITASVAETLTKVSDLREIVPHKTFEKPAKDAAKTVVRALAAGQRDDLQRITTFLADLGR